MAAAMPTLRELEPVVRRVLTERQAHALTLAAAGYSNRQAADVMGVCVATYANTRRRAIQKLQLALATGDEGS